LTTESKASDTATNDGASAPFKYLHTMLRVSDLDLSIKFYETRFGMKLRRRFDVEGTRRTLAFLGFGEEGENPILELGQEWDRSEPIVPGNGFGHIAFAVDDIETAFQKLKDDGVKTLQAPGATRKGGAIIAFVADPDGFPIELVQRPKASDRQRNIQFR
jgi:lactoylglutathione lyase